MNKQEIMAIEKPHINLLYLYLIRSLLLLPLFLIVFPPLLVRYLTLRYTFDENSITMRWGFLFRREVHITYSRIQDLHINCGLLQRWLGLADILIQTASGNSSAEVQIEGLMEYDAVRDFLYSKMRGTETEEQVGEEVSPEDQVLELLGGILNEMKGIKSVMQRLAGDHPETETVEKTVMPEPENKMPPPLQVDNFAPEPTAQNTNISAEEDENA
jgi:putative membrane protein